MSSPYTTEKNPTDLDVNRYKIETNNDSYKIETNNDKLLLNEDKYNSNKNWQQEKDIDKEKDTKESFVSNMVEAAKSAGVKVKDAASGAMEKVKEKLSSDEVPEDKTAKFGKEKIDTSKEKTDKIVSSREETIDIRKEKVKEDDYSYSDDKNLESNKTTTEKIKDVAYDAKEKLKDFARNMQEQKKDTSHDTKEKAKSTDFETKEKAKDTTYYAKDSSLNANSTTSGGKTEEIKNTVANTAQDWIADTKQKFNQEINKAQETKKEPVTSTSYYQSTVVEIITEKQLQ